MRFHVFLASENLPENSQLIRLLLWQKHTSVDTSTRGVPCRRSSPIFDLPELGTAFYRSFPTRTTHDGVTRQEKLAILCFKTIILISIDGSTLYLFGSVLTLTLSRCVPSGFWNTIRT
jgi:hypothetical protein